MMVFSDIAVKYINHMGSDLTVVNAARVSFEKESDWAEEEGQRVLSERDMKLISFLARNNHWSPFAHTSLQFRIKAPIFVARQLVKHQVGLVWNEVSRRYVDSDPEFFVPDNWRERAADKKQGSGGDLQTTPAITSDYIAMMEAILAFYKKLLADGVAPEQARMVLPQSAMTEWYWTGSLYAFARVVALRDKPDAQAETRVIAQKISDYAATAFPVSWTALTNAANKN